MTQPAESTTTQTHYEGVKRVSEFWELGDGWKRRWVLTPEGWDYEDQPVKETYE